MAAALALASCGGGSSAPATSAIDLKSPGIQANGELKPSTRCGWGSLWIPLEWGELPEDTKELAIYLGRFGYAKENGKRKVVVHFADLVSKFKPTEHKLVANVLPEGVSWSYFGTNCLPQGGGRGQSILLEVFALDRIHQRTMKRALATRLTEEALADPNPTEGPRSPGELTADSVAVGRLITPYTTGPH
ncbi:MAG TPA: hypothetical protein VFJ64_12970 [Solirubrobacterales bacterium]|nr:hypothetical protein [Solirubrobacterales bacterium]